MSVEKSTIDRFGIRHSTLRSAAATTGDAAAERAAERAVDRTGDAATGPATGLPVAPALRRSFALLERRAPAVGGRLAEHLWFRLPASPATAVRTKRTPRGGEPFEVSWAHGTVRGRVYGDWGNPTAYLVHGWAGWWQQLAALVTPLVARGLCVVAFDAPSHGDSGAGRHGRRSTTFVEMAEALSAVVTEFGRPTVVVAHSAGGLAAVHALGLDVHPDALVLVAPPEGVEGMLPVFAGALGVGPRSQDVMVRLAERRVGTPVAELDLLTMASRHGSLPHLLVVHDRGDREAPFTGGVRIRDAWHDARLLATDGLGHRRVLWDPVVVQRVTTFAAAAAERVRRSSR